MNAFSVPVRNCTCTEPIAPVVAAVADAVVAAAFHRHRARDDAEDCDEREDADADEHARSLPAGRPRLRRREVVGVSTYVLPA
jgi:hypothetical protein